MFSVKIVWVQWTGPHNVLKMLSLVSRYPAPSVSNSRWPLSAVRTVVRETTARFIASRLLLRRACSASLKASSSSRTTSTQLGEPLLAVTGIAEADPSDRLRVVRGGTVNEVSFLLFADSFFELLLVFLRAIPSAVRRILGALLIPHLSSLKEYSRWPLQQFRHQNTRFPALFQRHTTWHDFFFCFPFWQFKQI